MTTGGMERIMATRILWTLGTEDGGGGRKQKSIIFPHSWNDIVPVCTSIIAPAVARNGLARMNLKVLIHV